jgi:hypothetical protein
LKKSLNGNQVKSNLFINYFLVHDKKIIH